MLYHKTYIQSTILLLLILWNQTLNQSTHIIINQESTRLKNEIIRVYRQKVMPL